MKEEFLQAEDGWIGEMDLVEAVSRELFRGSDSSSANTLLSTLIAKVNPSDSPGLNFLSPATLFDAFAQNRYPDLRRQYESYFEVVALPGETLERVLQPGDLLIRRSLGEGNLAHLAILATGEIIGHDQLADEGLQAESACAGNYIQVIEPGPFPKPLAALFARQLAGADGRLGLDQLILRVKLSEDENGETETESGLWLEAAWVTFQVRNRILRWDAVANCNLELVGDSHQVNGRTNAHGQLRLDLAGLPDGEYTLRATPAENTTDPVGPATATNKPTPDRIWRPLATPVTLRGERIVGAGDTNVSVAGRTVTVQLQPVWMRSRYRSPRSAGVTPNLIIVHHTAGTAARNALNQFLSGGTSTHYLVDTDGQVIKLVSDAEQSWHAGPSHWQGQNSVNMFSIGIEIVHRSGAYPREQMEAVINLLQRIRNVNPGIAAQNIVGHSDIAICKRSSTDASCTRRCPGTGRRLGRKLGDPGPNFDWAQLNTAGLGLPVPSSPLPTLAGGDYGGFFVAVPGGFLQAGDRDDRQRYGGSVRSTLTTPVIEELQRDLSSIGYFCPVDGRYGSQTTCAVRVFQEHFMTTAGLPVAHPGQVGESTAKAIKFVRT